MKLKTKQYKFLYARTSLCTLHCVGINMKLNTPEIKVRQRKILHIHNQAFAYANVVM